MLHGSPAAMVLTLRLPDVGVDCVNFTGWSCLHQAAWYGELEHVRALLGAGADPLLPTAEAFGKVPRGACAAQIARRACAAGGRGAIVAELRLAALPRRLALACHPAVCAGTRAGFLAAAQALYAALAGQPWCAPL